jgi:hypothetical protein
MLLENYELKSIVKRMMHLHHSGQEGWYEQEEW